MAMAMTNRPVIRTSSHAQYGSMAKNIHTAATNINTRPMIAMLTSRLSEIGLRRTARGLLTVFMIGPPFFFAQITLRIACARLVSFSDNLTSVSPESRGRSIAPWNGPHKTENAWRTRRVPFIDGTLAARQEGNSLHL